MPPWLLSTVLSVVQFALSLDTCSWYCVAWARSQSMRTRSIATDWPKSSTSHWLSVKALLHRVLLSWSIAAAADRSPRSWPLAVAATGVSATPMLSPAAIGRTRPPSPTDDEDTPDESLLPDAGLGALPPHPAIRMARAQCIPSKELMRTERETGSFIGPPPS